MARRNQAGKTWKEHAAPFLSRALNQAARTWKPKARREADARIVKRLQEQRQKINAQIKKIKES